MDNEEENQSVDDVLEQERSGKLNHTVGANPLPEDYDSPAAPANDTAETTQSSEHPTHDTDVDDDERYEGEV